MKTLAERGLAASGPRRSPAPGAAAPAPAADRRAAAEAEHRAFMARNNPDAARALGYEVPRLDLTAKAMPGTGTLKGLDY